MATKRRVEVCTGIFILLLCVCGKFVIVLGDDPVQGDNGNEKFINQPVYAANNQNNLRDQPPPVVLKENPSFDNNHMNRHPPKPIDKATFRIADDSRCSAEVSHYCARLSTNNFAILECLQSKVKNYDEIGKPCQNLLWEYKRNLTLDDRFEYAAWEVCKTTLADEQFKHCQSKTKGRTVSCLIESKMNVTDSNCNQFLKKMGAIVFSDYHFVYGFLDSCGSDIKKLQCGRLHNEGDGHPHSQGRVIECLENDIDKIDEKCQKQILHISELQADDFHQDRPLYFACLDDRDKYCENVVPGHGKVFKCLYKNKFHVSTECKEKLVERQRLIQKDYKVSYTFMETCHKDIKKAGCHKLPSQPRTKQGRMSATLLCLENTLRNTKGGEIVSQECMSEMKAWRESLMNDYQITPEIVNGCAAEIQTHCKGLGREGKTLHCLMDLARPSQHKFKDQAEISGTCHGALGELIAEADPGSDFSIDPLIVSHCKSFADSKCKGVKSGTGEVLACLMDHIDDNDMDEDCAERLLELQYFLARDYRLDRKLFKACRADAIEVNCITEAELSSKQDMVERGPLFLSCLRNAIKHPKEKSVSRTCASEVRRIMRQRTINIDLEPTIEDACMTDLAEYCSKNEHTEEKGGEMDCLEDNYETLSQNCKAEMGKFIEDEDEDPLLDRTLMKACMPMVERFCKNEMKADSETSDLMGCLIEHKHHPDMNDKCTCGIEHHQIITAKNFTFSTKFKQACKDSARKWCHDKSKKAEVVYCLSEHVFNDTIMDVKEPRIPASCKKQLRYELLTQSEAIELDPVLKKMCSNDIKEYCTKPNGDSDSGKIEECLKEHQKKLEHTCYLQIFKKEKLEIGVAGGDFVLFRTCKSMIKQHCHQENEKGMLNCLKRFANERGFDPACKRKVDDRSILQHQDFRLNPALHKACRLDIPKFCKEVITAQAKQHDLANLQELQGAVLQCLKKEFAKKDSRLSPQCGEQIRGLIQESQLDYRKDPLLGKNCAFEMKEYCSRELDLVNDGKTDEGIVEECLKANIQKMPAGSKCMMEVIRLFVEGHADIHVDPLLHQACTLDLLHYCKDVPKGAGRQMSCMLSALDDSTVQLTPPCKKELLNRRELWAFAAKVAPKEFGDIIDAVMASPARNSFLGVAFAIVITILIVGLFCGRVTKRVSVQAKNK